MPTHTLNEILKRKMQDVKITESDIRNSAEVKKIAIQAQKQNEANLKRK